ncbi:hypothetical protein BDQ17DRAFT_1333175 [Cyathus striatus]|nr:hypothetical protein BDQ17DRAFT_1333175 [Cyathus striatus]
MAPRSLRSATAAASSIPATSTSLREEGQLSLEGGGRSVRKGKGGKRIVSDNEEEEEEEEEERKSSYVLAGKALFKDLKKTSKMKLLGKPKRFTKVEKILENSNISVAPPPHYRECSGTVTPASILQVPTPQDPFSSLSNDMGHLFNEHETSLVFSSHPGQIQEEDIDYEVIETTPRKATEKQGRSSSPESPTLSTSSHSSKISEGTKYKSIQVSNPYVFLWEDNGWSLTGQYSELLEDKDQEVQWELDEDKSTFCRILLEGLGTTPAANVSGVPSVFSEEASTSSASKLGEFTEAQKRIIDFFKVPLALHDHRAVSIHLQYAKWVFIENIIKKFPTMISAGKWQNKMPPISVIATIFTSVPAYYRWKALFSKLPKYPKMELWFEGNPDISDYEVWKGEPQTQEALKIILKKFGKEDKKLAKEKDEDSSADDNYKSKDKGKERKE